jgi:hypothetical protein
MDVFLKHMDMGPLIYGVVIFIGLWSVWWKLTHNRFITAVVEIAVFILVFKLHGGTMAGGFAATVAALIAGIVLPLSMPKGWR